MIRDGNIVTINFKKPEQYFDNFYDYIYSLSDSFVDIIENNSTETHYNITTNISNEMVIDNIQKYLDDYCTISLNGIPVHGVYMFDSFAKKFAKLIQNFFPEDLIKYSFEKEKSDVHILYITKNDKEILIPRHIYNCLNLLTKDYTFNSDYYGILSFEPKEIFLFFVNNGKFTNGTRYFNITNNSNHYLNVPTHLKCIYLDKLKDETFERNIKNVSYFIKHNTLIVEKVKLTTLRQELKRVALNFSLCLHVTSMMPNYHCINLWEIEYGLLIMNDKFFHITKCFYCPPYILTKKKFNYEDIENTEESIAVINITEDNGISDFDVSTNSLESSDTIFERKQIEFLNIDNDVKILNKLIFIFNVFKTLSELISEQNFLVKNLNNVNVEKDLSVDIKFTSLMQKQKFEYILKQQKINFFGLLIENDLSLALAIREKFYNEFSEFCFPIFNVENQFPELGWRNLINEKQLLFRSTNLSTSLNSCKENTYGKYVMLVPIDKESLLQKLISVSTLELKLHWEESFFDKYKNKINLSETSIDEKKFEFDIMEHLNFMILKDGYYINRNDFVNSMRHPISNNFFSQQTRTLEKVHNHFYGLKTIGDIKGIFDVEENDKFFAGFQFSITSYPKEKLMVHVLASKYLVINNIINIDKKYYFPLSFDDEYYAMYWIIQGCLQGQIINILYYEYYINYGIILDDNPFNIDFLRDINQYDIWFQDLISNCIGKEKKFKIIIDNIIKNVKEI